jgi:diguanylate cyclase (GGDEF)-like protein
MLPTDLRQRLKVLLVEDDVAGARRSCETLRRVDAIRLDRVTSLTEARERVRQVDYDAALLDLSLPDAAGLAALDTLRAAAPELPIVVYGGQAEEELALRAVQQGAQDCLVERNADPEIVLRALRYAIERQRASGPLHRILDDVTALPTRVLFEDRLRQALRSARRNARSLALVHVAAGRPASPGRGQKRLGAPLVRGLAQRLTSCLRASDTVGHVGEDEFMVLLAELSRPGHVAVVAERILTTASRPFRVEGQDVPLAVHLGIALFPNDGETAHTLLRRAATALERARAGGRSDYRFFLPALNAKTLDRRELGCALRDGLRRGEFELNYQPQLDLETGRICSVEALLRWSHPGGSVPPALFLPVAEEVGLGERLGEWVLRRACTQVRAWQDDHAAVGMSVNLSRSQLCAGAFHDTVLRVLRDTDLDARWLELEVQETDLIDNRERAVATLERLQELGVTLSLDGFAARSLPVRQLRDLPIEGVKLDRSLVCGLPADANASAIVSGIICLAHGFERRVTANGIETAEQVELLRTSSCDRLQGFLLSRPRPAADVVALLGVSPPGPAVPVL